MCLSFASRSWVAIFAFRLVVLLFTSCAPQTKMVYGELFGKIVQNRRYCEWRRNGEWSISVVDTAIRPHRLGLAPSKPSPKCSFPIALPLLLSFLIDRFHSRSFTRPARALLARIVSYVRVFGFVTHHVLRYFSLDYPTDGRKGAQYRRLKVY